MSTTMNALAISETPCSPANTVAPATIPPHMYVAVPGQTIPMQPMAFAQQQAYPQFGVHPAAMPQASEDNTNLVSERVTCTWSLKMRNTLLSICIQLASSHV